MAHSNHEPWLFAASGDSLALGTPESMQKDKHAHVHGQEWSSGCVRAHNKPFTSGPEYPSGVGFLQGKHKVFQSDVRPLRTWMCALCKDRQQKGALGHPARRS